MPTKTRLQGIDALRVVAFIFIVALHSSSTGLAPEYREPLEILPRFGVPFFFLVSGYFLKIHEMKAAELIVKFLKRLLPIYIVWLTVYLVVYRLLNDDFGIRSLRHFLVDGYPGFHLWFLPSLGVCVVTVVALAKVVGKGATLGVCAALYCIGVYYEEFLAPYGPQIPWNFRDGPFFGAIFVAVGYFIRRDGWRPSVATAFSLLLGGLAVSAVERYLLIHSGVVTTTTNIDYFIGTIAYGLGSLALALNLPSKSRVVDLLANMGKFALGFYCIHIVFLWLLLRIFPAVSIGNVIVCIVGTVCLSIAAVMILSRVKPLRRLIS